MNFRKDVTFFARKTLGNDTIWEKIFVKKAYVTIKKSANSNISVRGFVPNSNIIVRFSPMKNFYPKPGDRIFLGNTDNDIPSEGCYSVLSTTGGDRGARTIRLIKAVCG